MLDETAAQGSKADNQEVPAQIHQESDFIPDELQDLYKVGVWIIRIAEGVFVAASALLIFFAVKTDLTASSPPADYLKTYAPSLLLIVAAGVSTVFGFIVLYSVGARNRVIIPEVHREVLHELIRKRDREAIELYIRLSALSGVTGFFQKMGFHGLPLATICLSVAFGLLALLVPASDALHQTFADLAKLTLGAFLGSYVQRQRGDEETAIREIAVRELGDKEK